MTPTPENIARCRAELAAAEIERAASVLRAAGWTVVAPVDPGAGIPEPKPGECWFAIGGPGRTVDRVSAGNVEYHRGWQAWTCSPDAWMRWARKTGARPATTGDAQ